MKMFDIYKPEKSKNDGYLDSVEVTCSFGYPKPKDNQIKEKLLQIKIEK